MRCSKCRLHKTCQSVKIDGRGSDSPEVMFVGQAPGKEEDLRNKCFVGPAGQLLTQAISRYGLKPAYITNFVKCFPPGDRDPKADEMEACKPYLIEEIRRIKPEIVVLLGNIPLKGLLGLKGVTQYSGKIIEKDGQKFFPLLHPSYILRYPHNQALFENHLKALSREISGEETTRVKTVQMNTRQADAWLDAVKDNLIAFDYETTGITNISVGKVRCMAFSDGKMGIWVDAKEDGFESFARGFLTGPAAKVAHNSIFERRCSYENFGVYPNRLKHDTYAMHYLLDENSSHGLDVLAGKFLDAPLYDIFDDTPDFYSTVSMEKLGPYCATDAYYTRKLSEVFFEKIRSTPKLLSVYKNILMPLCRVCAKMEVNGAFLDLKWAKSVDELLGKEMESDQFNFRRLAKTAMQKVHLWTDDFNLNSAVQVRKVLEDGLGLSIFEKTESGKSSVAESVIEKLVDKHPSIKFYLSWKKNQTKRNNFLQKYPKFSDEEGLIHASINPCFVVTGRLSVTRPPLQAVDTNPLIRGMFRSRFEGGRIASCDFKQLEVRLVASESNETSLLTAIGRGDDLHAFTASLLFGKSFTKEDRNEAKRINFGVVYGITGYALALQINKPEKYAYQLIENFFKQYPNIKTWMDKQRKFVEEKGYIESKFGRIRRLGDVSNLPDWQKASVIRQAGNFPIQSAGADLTNISLVEIFRRFKKWNLESLPFMQIHDSVLVDVFPGEEDTVKHIIIDVMTNFVQNMCPWLRVKLDVDYSITKRWDGMTWKKLKELQNGRNSIPQNKG